MAQRNINPLDPSAAFGGSSVPTLTGMGRASVNSDINVTPMVDVMLVLLIIFMVITPVLTSYEAALPEAENIVPEPDDDVVTLGIDANGLYHIGGDAIAPAQLAGTLRGIYAGRPNDHLLFLRADRSIDYSIVLNAIGAARAAGVRTIGAITIPVELDAR
ncbi:biopolymer transporter ExbD [soil metagenome]